MAFLVDAEADGSVRPGQHLILQLGLNRSRSAQVVPGLVGIRNFQAGEGIWPIGDVDVVIIDVVFDPLVTFDPKDGSRVRNRRPILGVSPKGDDLAEPVITSNVSGLAAPVPDSMLMTSLYAR
jgi:hypothetical protein